MAALAALDGAVHIFGVDLRLDLLAKLLLAVVLGGAVGLERELSGKPAGLRTNILICLGSAILMDLSTRISVLPDGTRVGDPARLAAQVVTGIGFLGAGTILQARGVVVGLTTAATIWVVAAIGLTVGAGAYVEAVGATVMVTLVLVGLRKAERSLLTRRRVVSGTIRANPGTSFDQIKDMLNAYGLIVQSHKRFDHNSDTTYEVRVSGPAKQFDSAALELTANPSVMSVTFE